MDLNRVFEFFDCFQSAFIYTILFAHKITNEVGIISFIFSPASRAGKLKVKK